ncbi:hypothetical protein FIBSPDRAFT_287169 [Athelia psychrophila]|uniref:Uncharacterized protein n=1 Tax=Athelia psychrophila TaxID=1759441 RepID=A0A167XPQ9_9AGAM|nr:hypothetical protein FIBSPDRAFT_287169 [Fibularhizoctonia sp. CBS 109695]
MDVFGAGCVIAELFVEDAPGFTVHARQLLKSREGELFVDGTLILGAIEDEGVRVRIYSPPCIPASELISP